MCVHQRSVGLSKEWPCFPGSSERTVAVRAVDVHVLSDISHYERMRCFCNAIHRIRPDELFEIAEPEHAALCFFWGRALPWRAYLRQYPQIPLVCIAGEDAEEGADCATEPRVGALHGAPGWHRCLRTPVRAVHGGAMLSVYERVD